MDGSHLEFNNPIQDAVTRLQFAPESNNLLISSWDSILRLYDVDECQLRFEASNHGAAVLDCCFESETLALSANSDGSVCRYDMYSGSHSAIGNHEDAVTRVEYSQETCQVISAGWDKKIKFWDARSSCSSTSLINLGREAESISIAGFTLLVALKSSVHMYDLRNLDTMAEAKGASREIIHIKCVRANLDVEDLGFAVGSVDGRVALEYLNKSISSNKGYAFRCRPTDKSGIHHLATVNDISFNPAFSNVLATGDNDGHAIIWDVMNKTRIVELPQYPNSVASLAYNCGGQLLAVASSYTYQEANEREELPQIFVHRMDDVMARVRGMGFK